MKFVVHHRYRGLDAGGNPMNVRYGTEYETIGDFIATPEGRGICFTASEAAKEYFAVNDDGRGLERGALTHAIAYSHREREWPDGSVRRFSEAEVEMLETSWGHWLRQDVDTILFNNDFFAAQPEDLQRLADALKIKVRR